MKNREPKRWRVGRLIVIRYWLQNESLFGVIFAHEHGHRRMVEVMVGRFNYVFYVDVR